MTDLIKIRWKEGIGLFIFLVFAGLYFFSEMEMPGYFAFFDFLNFGDENYWINLFDTFSTIIFPAPFLVGVFLYSLYKTEKNIKEGNAVFVKILERSLVVGLISSFAWGLLELFPTSYSYRSDNAIIPLFIFSYFWMMPVAPTVLAFLFSFIPSLLLRVFYLNQKKFYGAIAGFFVFLFLGLFAYQQLALKNCNFNRDEHCLANMAIKTNDSSFCDKAKSDNQKNICLKIIERKNNKNEATETIDWKIYRNEEYGFEFKYPKGYETIDQLNDGGQLTIKPEGENEVPFLNIEFIYNKDKYFENDSLRRLSDTNKYRKFIDEKIKVGGFEGRMVGNSGEKDTEESPYREIFIDLKEKILFIESVSFDDKTFNQIISTFKFTK